MSHLPVNRNRHVKLTVLVASESTTLVAFLFVSNLHDMIGSPLNKFGNCTCDLRSTFLQPKEAGCVCSFAAGRRPRNQSCNLEPVGEILRFKYSPSTAKNRWRPTSMQSFGRFVRWSGRDSKCARRRYSPCSHTRRYPSSRSSQAGRLHFQFFWGRGGPAR